MLPLYSVSQSRDADKYASETLSIPGVVLMENAGRSIFDAMLKEYAIIPGDMMAVLCGKGNNGGDGYVLARHLANYGCKVTVVICTDEETFAGDTAENFRIIKNLQINTSDLQIIKYQKETFPSAIGCCKFIVDAMLGTGVKGAIKEPYDSIVNAVNKCSAVKIAADIPTGLDADTGWGENVFDADLTVTMAAPKKGLFLGRGKNSAGKVAVGQIGIGNEFFKQLGTDCFLIESKDVLESLPIKKKDIHKYSSGKVLVIAGSSSYTGAAVLTVSASLRTGTGASIICVPESVKNVIQTKVTEEVVCGYNDNGCGCLTAGNIGGLKEKLDWADVVAIGPGLGNNAGTFEAVKKLIGELKGRKVVLDADAIRAVSDKKYLELDIEGFVITPHYKEFADLIGISVGELKKDPLCFGKEFAGTTGAYLVLKGAPTIVFTPEGKCCINSCGNPGMAKFGTGDVLTGIITSFIAQSESISEAIINSVYLHSYAADAAAEEKTEYCLAASDIIDYFPSALKKLKN